MAGEDPRKRACDELAELLSTPAGLRTARLLQLTEALRPPGPASQQPEPSSEGAGPQPISIWQPQEVDGETVFQRPAPLPLGDHYAATPSLEKHKAPGVQRICYFGESVAAGYLYAPLLTPAHVLADALSPIDDEPPYEVIDLARTNETLDPLVATVEQSLQLDPDVLVIFVGNNWTLLETPSVSPYVPSVSARQRFALALRRGGVKEAAKLAQRDMLRRADHALAKIATLASGIPVVLIIPEVNLADWHDRQPVAWLPGDGCTKWYEHYEEAQRLLDQGQADGALRAAEAMLELDGGTTPTTHRLRALALLALERHQEARAACEEEVASGSYATQAFLGAPRASREGQALLRRSAARHGFTIVDLPRLFREITDNPLPGRRLFLDYCHLSAEGIRIAMSAVAEEVRRLASPAPSKPITPSSNLEVEPATKALALLGAAVHSAHRLLFVGDKRQILETWCREALAADPQIADAMQDLLKARCGSGPAVLNAAQQNNLKSRHRLLLQHGWRWDYLDIDLVEALCNALEEAGHSVRDETTNLLVRHHGVESGVDLTQPPYLAEPLERFYPEAMAVRGLTGRATYRAAWPETHFCWVASGKQDIRLTLTLRIPGAETEPRSGQVAVRLDGAEVASVEACESWRSHEIDLAHAVLSRGMHRLTLVWPPPEPHGDLAIAEMIHRLENGIEADLHPVFGEVFALRADQHGGAGTGLPSFDARRAPR